MSNPKPYDHTTPPSSPRTNVHSQTPRLDPIPAALSAIVDPRQNSPATACPPTPRLAPREGRKVARDDSYYPLRKSATFPGCFVSASTKKATMTAAQAQQGYNPPHLPVSIERPSDQDLALLRKITPLTLPTINYTVPVTMPISKPPAKPQVSATPKPRIKRRRPSEIFNMAFSFSNPSLRRPSDHTPQISPRTSISSESGSPTPTPEKRQRVDLSGSNTNMFNPFTRSSATYNAHGYNMGSYPTSQANIWVEEGLSRYPFVHTSTEAHPGHPVNFSTQPPSHCTIQSETETYHTYLTESRRRNSSPDPRPHSPYDYKEKLHEDRLNKEARILGLTSNIPNRKRACTLERTGRTTRKSPPQTTPYASSSNASMKSRYSGRTSSTASDPSMERFLTHVRASQEARAAMQSHRELEKSDCVFTSEEENPLGYFDLGDKPL